MTAKLTFHPLDKADCARIDAAKGRKMLVDCAVMRNPAYALSTRVSLAFTTYTTTAP